MPLASAPVVSPDGRHIAFVGATDSRSELWIRDLASLDARAIPGTVGAMQPFWSPDSRSLGFFAERKLLRVNLDSGAPPVTLADAPDAGGGTWSRERARSSFSPSVRESSLMRVSADGGRVEPATDVRHHVRRCLASLAGISPGRRALSVFRDSRCRMRGAACTSAASRNRRVAGQLVAGGGVRSHIRRAGRLGRGHAADGAIEPCGGKAVRCPHVEFRRRGHDDRAASRRHVASISGVARRVGRCPGRWRHADSVWRSARHDVHDRRAPPGIPRCRAHRVPASFAGRPAARANRRWIRYAATLIYGSRIWTAAPSCD